MRRAQLRLKDAVRRVIVAVGALHISHAAHAELCVQCTGPDAAYACSVEGAPSVNGDPRFALLCITELAKAGGHQSCAVSRAVTSPCPGAPRVVAQPSNEPGNSGRPLANSPAGAPAERTSAGDGTARPAPAGVDAETVVTKTNEPAKAIEQKSQDGASDEGEAGATAGGMMEQAGESVAKAAKSTWKCLSSFFGDC